MILLSPFLDVIRMSMSTGSFLAQERNSLHAECFYLTFNLNGFKSRVNRYLFSLSSLHTAFLYDFHLFLLLLVTSSLTVAFSFAWSEIQLKKLARHQASSAAE